MASQECSASTSSRPRAPASARRTGSSSSSVRRNAERGQVARADQHRRRRPHPATHHVEADDRVQLPGLPGPPCPALEPGRHQHNRGASVLTFSASRPSAPRYSIRPRWIARLGRLRPRDCLLRPRTTYTWIASVIAWSTEIASSTLPAPMRLTTARDDLVVDAGESTASDLHSRGPRSANAGSHLPAPKPGPFPAGENGEHHAHGAY